MNSFELSFLSLKNQKMRRNTFLFVILHIVCILSNFSVESSTCEEIADRVDCSSGVVNLTRQSCENRGWYVFDDEALTYVFSY